MTAVVRLSEIAALAEAHQVTLDAVAAAERTAERARLAYNAALSAHLIALNRAATS